MNLKSLKCAAALLVLNASSALFAAQPADTVFHNGAIYTVNEKQPWAEAIAIRDGVIDWLGSDEAADRYIGSETEVIDLRGRMLMPGFHDVHIHTLESGSTVGGNCELERGREPASYKRALRRCARLARGTGTEWVLAYGHSLHQLLEAEERPVDILDAIIDDRPVAVMEETSHSIWINSVAMKLAEIQRTSEDPVGGMILRDEDGEPNGILLESAGDRVYDLALQPNPIAAEINYQGLLEVLEQLAANGITSFSDARVYWRRGWMDVWERAEREDTLTARAVLGLWTYPHLPDSVQIPKLISMYSFKPESLLRVSQIKMYNDGILHNTTSRMLEPYVKSLPGVPPLGISYFPEKRMGHYVTELQQAGFDMHIHAIGDRAVRESLNAIESAAKKRGGRDARHRLTHVEQVHPRDRKRFAALDVIADFQLAGEFTKPENEAWMEPVIGDRAHDSIPIHEIYASGAMVTLSSDWTVSPMSPFQGLQNAITRDDRGLPDLHAAIRAYTLNGAYTMRHEGRVGSLEVGKLADLIVLDQSLFEINPKEISDTEVLMTMLEGDVVFKSKRMKANTSRWKPR